MTELALEHRRFARRAFLSLLASVALGLAAWMWNPVTWGPTYVGGIDVGSAFGYGMKLVLVVGCIVALVVAVRAFLHARALRRAIIDGDPL